MTPSPSILVIAGEVSGDMHAARLVTALRAKQPDLSFFGIGGDEMKHAGVELFQHVSDMAVMGLSEVLRRLAFFRRVYNEMLRLLEERTPAAVILVDYPGFNLRFAGDAHARGFKTIYYVCPQVWAWNRGRIPKMARVVDRLLSIFPFEAAHFDGTGLAIDFVGHPLVDETREALRAPTTPLPWKDSPRIALLPGSRIHEIERILPVLWKTAVLLERQYPTASFLLAAPSSEIAAHLHCVTAQLGAGPSRWAIVSGCTRETLRQATAALVASGTATVETALMGCPMAIVYRVGELTYQIGRLLVKTPYIGMVNIVAGREVCPEFLQHAAEPGAIARRFAPLLRESPERDTMMNDLREVAGRLGPGGAAERAAEAVLQEMASEKR